MVSRQNGGRGAYTRHIPVITLNASIRVIFGGQRQARISSTDGEDSQVTWLDPGAAKHIQKSTRVGVDRRTVNPYTVSTVDAPGDDHREETDQ